MPRALSSEATRILSPRTHLPRNLKLLAIANTDDTPMIMIISHIFTSLAIMDVYIVSIVHECQMLESELTLISISLLKNPQDAPAIVNSMKMDIATIKSDFGTLLSSAATHPSAKGLSPQWLKLPSGVGYGTLV